MGQRRIVSLLAAGTEVACLLGARAELVAISHECDEPEVKDLPRLSRPRLDPARRGGDLHADVRSLVAEGLSCYEVDVEQLRSLAPDVVITQDQCQACAVSLEDLQRSLGDWIGRSGVSVVSLRPNTLTDVWRDVHRIGAALAREDAAQALVARCEQRLAALASAVGDASPVPTLLLEWMNPLMIGGGWSAELVTIAGGRSLGPEPGEPTRTTSWEELLALDPEALFVAPRGYGLTRTLDEIEDLTGRPEWPRLQAVANGRAWALDGNALFNRSGPRLVESAELLAELLHPERVKTTHAETWARAL